MSDLLTHWAVFDDCRRLAVADATVEPLIKRLLDDKRDIARLGSVSRGGRWWMPHILKSAYAQRAQVDADPRLQQRIAYALGGILHYPADYVFKPFLSEVAQVDWDSTHHQMQDDTADEANAAIVQEVSAYYDCHVFKKVYLAGHEEPFNNFLLADNSTAPGQALEAFVRALFQRTLVSMHTFAPDRENFDEWLDNLLSSIPPLYLDIDLYVRIFQDPDPQKIEQYRVETDFYCDSDPIIQLARALQQGATIHQEELETALSTRENHSGYARSLGLGVEAIREASSFWRGEVDEPPDLSQG